MGNKKENSFLPVIAIPPGETIKENMVFLGMTQEEMAIRLDITPKHLCNILNGNAPITYETALKLESVIGPSAEFWVKLESSYQLDKTRLEAQDEFKTDLEITKEIPYKKMSDLGWLEDTSDRKQRVKNLRDFFGVARLFLIKKSYAAVFRKHKQKKEISDFSVLAWLRKAELEGRSIEVQKVSRSKLKSLIPRFRELTMEEPSFFYSEMQKLCAQCGVALVLAECLPKTYICGATMWRKDKAILALSVRGKRADIFWFTFFHELAHLINHKKKEFHISYENQEDEADQIARNYLIPDKLYKKFIEEYPYKDKKTIIDYAHKIGIAPCILVGRLMHDKLVDYQYYSDLRPSFEIVNKETVAG
jgi:HTH-type transcriptional regulator / antitoxin HigA